MPKIEDQSQKAPSVAIVPMLYLKDLSAAIDFYKKAFGAVERWSIEHEGRTHVAELMIGQVLLRLHEEVGRERELSPLTLNATSVGIELLVSNPDELFAKAIVLSWREAETLGPCSTT